MSDINKSARKAVKSSPAGESLPAGCSLEHCTVLSPASCGNLQEDSWENRAIIKTLAGRLKAKGIDSPEEEALEGVPPDPDAFCCR